jgi:prophage regulatory protein
MTVATMIRTETASLAILANPPVPLEIKAPVPAKLSWSHVDDGERLLRIPQLSAILGISRATIYRYIASGKLPKPVKLSARCVAWKASVICAWMAELWT